MRYLKEYDEINEKFSNKVNNFISKYRKEIKLFAGKFKNEIKESKEMSRILRKGKSNITDVESKFIKKQMIDIAKTLGLGAVFMIPFVGLASVALLIYIDKILKIGILPSSFN